MLDLLDEAKSLISDARPLSYNHGSVANHEQLTSVCERIRAMLPRLTKSIPSETELKKWRMLSVPAFTKQQRMFLGRLDSIRCSLEASPVPPEFDSILSAVRLLSVRENLLQAHRSLFREDWKAAIIMSGSALEAALQAKIAEDLPRFQETFMSRWPSRKVPSNAEAFRPADALAVIVDAGVLPSATAKYAEGLQQSRNIVHPSVEKREGLRSTRLDANIAIKVVLVVIKRLWT